MFRSFQIIIKEFRRALLKLLHTKVITYKNELNREYVITLARNDETP